MKIVPLEIARVKVSLRMDSHSVRVKISVDEYVSAMKRIGPILQYEEHGIQSKQVTPLPE